MYSNLFDSLIKRTMSSIPYFMNYSITKFLEENFFTKEHMISGGDRFSLGKIVVRLYLSDLYIYDNGKMIYDYSNQKIQNKTYTQNELNKEITGVLSVLIREYKFKQILEC